MPLTVWLARPDVPADGIPLAVKDLFDTAGLETTYGSALFAGHVPRTTAAAVERLEAAGYAVAGKTNLHEFAYGTTSENPHFGDVPNPAVPGGWPMAGDVATCERMLEALAQEYRPRRLESLEELEVGVAWTELADPLVAVTPTLPIVPPPLGRDAVGDLDVREALIRFTYPFSALGWPALALPAGAAEDDAPASLQIAGRAGDDALVLAAGRLLSPL